MFPAPCSLDLILSSSSSSVQPAGSPALFASSSFLLINRAWYDVWKQTDRVMETRRRWQRAATDQVFFFFFPFILFSLCSLVSTIHPATMNNARDWLFFLNIQTFQGKLLTESVFRQERNLIKNVFIICGGGGEGITTEAGFEMQILTETPVMEPHEYFSGCGSTNCFCFLF